MKIFKIFGKQENGVQYTFVKFLGLIFKLKIDGYKYISNHLKVNSISKSQKVLVENYLQTNKNARILVCLHIFYVDSWTVIAKYLDNLKEYNYDLIVTCADGYYSEELLENIRKYKPNVKIFIKENVGYDIAPFIDVLNKVDLNNYDIVFKLQSKGVSRPFIYIYNQVFRYEDWFLNLFNGILGAFNVHSTIDALLNKSEIGIVAAENLIINDPIHKQDFTAKVADEYNIKINDNYKYVAGTCFAIKAELLKPIQNLHLNLEDFKGTRLRGFSLAHAMERIICASIETQGYEFFGNKVKYPAYKNDVKKLQKYSALRLLSDSNFSLDYDFFYKSLDLQFIEKYEIVKLKLKDIKRNWDDTVIALDECHPYKYLNGEKTQYEKYCIVNQSNNFYMSPERFENLINSINSNNFNESYMQVIVDDKVIDGLHRVSILLHKYGREHEIKCLKIIFKEKVVNDFWRKVIHTIRCCDGIEYLKKHSS